MSTDNKGKKEVETPVSSNVKKEENTEVIIEEASIDAQSESVEEEIITNEVEEEAEYNDMGMSTHSASFLPQNAQIYSDDFNDVFLAVRALDSMNILASTLVKSGLCPFKKPEDVILAIITGKQFNLPYMASVNNIYVVNGKPTLSAHLHRALLLREGVHYEKVYDFEPMYQFFKTDKDGAFVKVPHPTDQNKTIAVPVAVGTRHDNILNAAFFGNEVDRITRYKFTRKLKQKDGSYKELVIISEFKMSDAAKADLLKKDNWNNYPARMCDARAFTSGAREIGSDITLGILSLSEMADTTTIQYSISPTLEETVIVPNKVN